MVYHPGITNNAIAALTSFAFNEGTNALRKSTLLMALNQGRLDEAANGFLRGFTSRAYVTMVGEPTHQRTVVVSDADNDEPVAETHNKN